MPSSENITNSKIYDLLNAMRLELKGDIRDLRNQFDTLEAGRLTRAEANISDLRIDLQKAINQFNAGLSGDALRSSKISTTQALVTGILGAIGVALLTALAYKLIVGAK